MSQQCKEHDEEASRLKRKNAYLEEQLANLEQKLIEKDEDVSTMQGA